mgnify:CR=1 FL=1
MYDNDVRRTRRMGPDIDNTLPRMLRRGAAWRSTSTRTASPLSFHAQQGIKGFLSGIVVVVPVVLWLSGSPENASSDAANFRIPAVVISSVAVRPLPTVESTATAATLDADIQHIATDRAETLRLERAMIADRLIDAHGFIRDGNIERARELLADATVSTNPEAAYLLAETFDPNLLAALGITGVRADAARARDLYANALAGGVTAARQRLESLN